MRWSLIAVLALAGCKKSPEPVVVEPAPAPPVEAAVVVPDTAPAFWAWVGSHVEALNGVKTGREPVTRELAVELAKVDPHLIFELDIGRHPPALIISADGKKEFFPLVKQVVAVAPAMPGLEVIAFRPRKGIDGFILQAGDTTLAGKDLWFVASEDPDKKGLLAVQVYVKGMRSEHDEQLQDAAFAMLEATVGEFDLETRLGEIQFKRAPERVELPLKPLTELAATLDAFK